VWNRVDSNRSTSESKHLWHKWQPVNATVRVERRENLLAALHAHRIAAAQARSVCGTRQFGIHHHSPILSGSPTGSVVGT
jgi:hypothetical protein